MINDKTIYTIHDECGERTTITLDKLVADVLQEVLSDVHAWIQDTYIKITLLKPRLGRRQKGDLVRLVSLRKAEMLPRYDELINERLGL